MLSINQLNHTWTRRLQAAVTGVVLGSIISVLIHLRDQLVSVHWKFNPLYLGLSVIIVIVTMMAWAFIWAEMLKRLNGMNISIYEGVNLYILGNAAKYIPGSVWNYFARAYLGKLAGIRSQRVWTANFIEFVGSVMTGFILYALSQLWPHNHRVYLSLPILAVIILVLFLIITPASLRLLAGVFGHIRKKEVHPEDLQIRFTNSILFIGITCVIWVLIGFAFFFFIQSIQTLPTNYLPEIIGAWSLSISIGMIAVGLPQGLGIKEGVLVAVLSSMIPFPNAITISLLSRVWIIGCDLLVLLIWWLIRLVIKKRHSGVRITTNGLLN